jgi:ribosome-associated heat shock protein Hsp15
MRLDLALFLLRLFKSRSQATLAIAGGAVRLNDRQTKPGHEVVPGDRVTLVLPGGSRTLELLSLPTRSTSKAAATTLVREI